MTAVAYVQRSAPALASRTISLLGLINGSSVQPDSYEVIHSVPVLLSESERSFGFNDEPLAEITTTSIRMCSQQRTHIAFRVDQLPLARGSGSPPRK